MRGRPGSAWAWEVAGAEVSLIKSATEQILPLRGSSLVMVASVRRFEREIHLDQES